MEIGKRGGVSDGRMEGVKRGVGRKSGVRVRLGKRKTGNEERKVKREWDRSLRKDGCRRGGRR